MSRGLLENLMKAVPQEKYYGNPFKYILKYWDTRGKHLVESARLPSDDPFYEKDIVPAKIAHDIWLNMMVATVHGRHTEIIKNIEDFYFILSSVERMYTMGLSERQIKDTYYKEVYYLKENHPACSGTFQMVLGIMDYVSRTEEEKHEHIIDEQRNNDVRSHGDRYGPGPVADNNSILSSQQEDLIGGVDGPDLMEEGDK